MFSDDDGEGEVCGQASAQQLSRLSFSSTISGMLDSVFRYSTIIQYNTVTVQYSTVMDIVLRRQKVSSAGDQVQVAEAETNGVADTPETEEAAETAETSVVSEQVVVNGEHTEAELKSGGQEEDKVEDISVKEDEEQKVSRSSRVESSQSRSRLDEFSEDEEVEAEVARQQAGAGAGGLEWVSSLLFTLLSPAILITLHNLATANCE